MHKILFGICFLLVLFSSCTEDKLPLKSESFYYWKTVFNVSDKEQNVLNNKNVEKLYVRFFDLDVVDGNVEPVGKIVFKSKPDREIVPVLFITNSVFKMDELNEDELVTKTLDLIDKISNYEEITYKEIQIDCDWSDKTKDSYFKFLGRIKQKSEKIISATIRLHQVKYPDRTGIPPVDYGVLMYYNMGKLGANDKNSIYDRETALKYTPSLASYKLPLKTALPIFRWGVQLRNNQIISLIPKINLAEISNLKNISSTKYQVLKDTHYKNYYLKKEDVIKYESVDFTDLKNIINDINQYNSKATKEIIWYDLDDQNFTIYEKTTLF